MYRVGVILFVMVSAVTLGACLAATFVMLYTMAENFVK